MEEADMWSYYITIAAIGVAGVFVVLVVCGSVILFCRKGRVKENSKRLSLLVNLNESSPPTPSASSTKNVNGRSSRISNKREESRVVLEEEIKSTTINMVTLTSYSNSINNYLSYYDYEV